MHEASPWTQKPGENWIRNIWTNIPDEKSKDETADGPPFKFDDANNSQNLIFV